MKHSSLHSVLMTAVFCGLIAVLSILSVIMPKKSFSDTENRYLEKRPEFTWEALKSGEYGKDYEAYLSDQFPMRNQWISAKTAVEILQGRKEIHKVFLGKDDYLIEAHYPELTDQNIYRKNVERLSAFLKAQQNTLGKDHIRLMMVPSASEIMTEKLPSHASPMDQDLVAKDILENGPEDLSYFLPMEEIFLAAHQEDPEKQLYYKTDHHWTTTGAYEAYRAWCYSLGIEPYSRDEFKIKTVSDHFYGTIHSKLNTSVAADSIELFLPEEEPAYEVYYDGSKEHTDSLYAMDALETKDQYRVFLDGNHAITRIVNQDLDTGKRLVIIKDSYAHSFAPFASLHFDEVWMIDLRYFNGKLSSFIPQQDFTDVLVLYSIPGFLKEPNISKISR